MRASEWSQGHGNLPLTTYFLLTLDLGLRKTRVQGYKGQLCTCAVHECPHQSVIACCQGSKNVEARVTGERAIPTLLYGLESERVEKELIRRAVEVEGCPVRVLPVVIMTCEVAIRDVRSVQQHAWR
ncbi:hypothetical protein O3P69_003348 [Scylla paramamosain]|uniref:Uncharacterized protein n=1 Tax=Scylla paramamosain TaxID=85552 RepID=A0AAW0UJL0_SCYPA